MRIDIHTSVIQRLGGRAGNIDSGSLQLALRGPDSLRQAVRRSAGDRRVRRGGGRCEKAALAQHLTAYVALAAHIKRVLDERPAHSAPWSRFVDELEDHMSAEAAEQTLRAIISWGRYAEVVWVYFYWRRRGDVR